MVAFVNQQSLSKRQLFDGDISSTTLSKTHAPGYDLFTLDDIQIVRKYIYTKVTVTIMLHKLQRTWDFGNITIGFCHAKLLTDSGKEGKFTSPKSTKGIRYFDN